MRRLRPFVGLLTLALGGSAAAQDLCAGTRTLAESLTLGEIQVELRTVAGSPTKEGCAARLIAAPAESVFEVIHDAGRYAEFMPHVIHSVVETTADGATLNTQHIDLPFPFGNRYYTILLTARTPKKDPEEGATWKLEWSYVEGSGNVLENEGSWTLRRTASGQTLAVYRVHTNPAGLIPKWAVNRATKRGAREVLAAVARRVELAQQHESPGGG